MLRASAASGLVLGMDSCLCCEGEVEEDEGALATSYGAKEGGEDAPIAAEATTCDDDET